VSFAGGTVAEHAAASTVEGPGSARAQPVVAAAHQFEHVSGRAISWVGVAITCVGFVVGGIAFVPHPTWWLFWVGAAVVIVGSLVLVFAKTFDEDWY
jgi:hypothetical protein